LKIFKGLVVSSSTPQGNHGSGKVLSLAVLHNLLEAEESAQVVQESNQRIKYKFLPKDLDFLSWE
jgi:hypothetical protein